MNTMLRCTLRCTYLLVRRYVLFLLTYSYCTYWRSGGALERKSEKQLAKR